MNFLSLDFIQSSDLPHILFLPTYAATAWYHNALPRKRPNLATFLKEVEGTPDLHQELIDWFMTLPLWLDLPGIRVVHACWHADYMKTLSQHLTPDN